MNEYVVEVVNGLGDVRTFKVDGDSKDAVRKELEDEGYQVISITLLGINKTKK